MNANVALHPDPVNFISLCTGGGGLDLGIGLAMPDARAVCMVEREAFAVARLVEAMRAGLLAPAPVWSDARTLDGRRWRGLVDGVIGGIPCQPHSLAGKRLGRHDPRDLWSAARRIVVQSGAWWVFVENVGGMLTSGGAERVWRDLQRLGFAVEGGLFSAAEVGASHGRERLFILGVADAHGIGRRPEGHPIFAAVGVDRSGRPLAGVGWQPGRGDHGGDVRYESGAAGQRLEMADADGEQLERLRSDADQVRRKDAVRLAGLCDRTGLVDAARIGRGEGRAEPGIRSGRHSAAGAGGAMDDPLLARGRPVSIQPWRPLEAGGDLDRPGLFPPGPGDPTWAGIADRAPDLLPALSRHDRFLSAIRAARAAADGDPAARQGLEPDGPYGLRAAVVQEIAQSTLRGLADGVAGRVDQLRMLGNGVLPLQAGYALRTLAARLAASGHAGAALLVDLMDVVA